MSTQNKDKLDKLNQELERLIMEEKAAEIEVAKIEAVLAKRELAKRELAEIEAEFSKKEAELSKKETELTKKEAKLAKKEAVKRDAKRAETKSDENIRYDPYTIPNNGEGFDSINNIERTYMCFWLSLADGLNYLNYNDRQNWSWYELKDSIKNQTNDSGKLFDIGYTAKHMKAFNEIAKRLNIQIIVYPLQENKEQKRNSINEDISISSSNIEYSDTIKILHFRNHYEFIVGFGNNGGSRVAKKLAFIDQDDEAIKAVIIGLRGMNLQDRPRSFNHVIESINNSELESKQKTFMIKDINRQVLESNINMKKKYLKYKKKYLKFKKSLA